MKNALQPMGTISTMRLPAAGAALAFANMLLPGFISTRSAEAKTFTTLASFDRTNGANPVAPLVQAFNGNLYGTTLSGGTSPYCSGNGCGTIFMITPGGTLTSLHSFCLEEKIENVCSDGDMLPAGLVQATNGNLYGTTDYGGSPGAGFVGLGTVFKITPGGSLKRFTASAWRTGAAAIPQRRWSRLPTGTSTGQPLVAASTRARSSLRRIVYSLQPVLKRKSWAEEKMNARSTWEVTEMTRDSPCGRKPRHIPSRFFTCKDIGALTKTLEKFMQA
jgi:uncharacterized repeat protein (TIGR03803 family)